MPGGVDESGNPSGKGAVCEAGLSVSRSLLLLAGVEGGSGRLPVNASSSTISLWIQCSTSHHSLKGRQLTANNRQNSTYNGPK